LTAAALITATVRPGEIFIPMHYVEANRLTHWSVDPHSRQPAYKACAVALVGLHPRGKPSANGREKPASHRKP
jgi:assimilatory nitrate reductase catalytic subunit